MDSPYIQSRVSASTAPASHFAPSRFGLMLRRNFAKPDRFSAVNYEISHRNLWYFMGNPWDFMIFMGIYDILWGIHGILWYFMGNPWDFMIFYGESIGIYDILWIVWWYFMAFPMKMNHGWQKSLGCKHWKLWFFSPWMNEWMMMMMLASSNSGTKHVSGNQKHAHSGVGSEIEWMNRPTTYFYIIFPHHFMVDLDQKNVLGAPKADPMCNINQQS